MLKFLGMLFIGSFLGLGAYTASLPDAVAVTSIREVHVVNSAGINNNERHFSFEDGCVLERGGKVEQAAFTGDVRLMIYTAPTESVPSTFCPSGTHFVAFWNMTF
ncbi:hypothetical protein HZA87_00495 [Candidatus Uhrbacteria bacterium]|nr:hypothetical protein [Candidatus Uhrbacteria bacterium]